MKSPDPSGGDRVARGKTVRRIGCENSTDLVDSGVAKEMSGKGILLGGSEEDDETRGSATMTMFKNRKTTR